MKRFLKWAVPIILVLVLVAAVVFYLLLDRIVRSTVESQTAKSLNVSASLASADVSLWGGYVKLNKLAIGSPPGFSAPHLFTLGGVKVDVAYGQLTKEPIHVADITIEQPVLVLEQSGGKFNLKALMDQLPPTPPSDNDGKRQAGEPIKLVIGSLAINSAQVLVRPGIPGLQSEYKLAIPSVTLKNIGTGEGAQNGAAIQEVVMQSATALAAKASESDLLPPQLRGLLSGDLSQMASKLGQKFTAQLNEQAGKFMQDLQGKLPGGAAEALGGLLKGTGASTTQPSATNPAGALEEGLKGLLGPRKK